ncbi:MAG: MFS transporter [Actinomycetales bacterium]|nr:MFS transporter [Actinomycetales bacterium]
MTTSASAPTASRIRWLPIGLLEVTNLLSGVANGVVTIAIPWLVLDRTGSVAAAGAVAAISALPGLLAAPLAGWAVDHFGRRIVSVISDVLSAISVAAIPIVGMFTELTLPWIIALAVLGAIFDPAGYTARKALIPDVASASGMAVTRLNGIHEGVFSIGWVIGPLAGAVLIGTLGAVAAFWVPCGAFVIAAGLIALLRVRDAGQEAKEAREKAGEAHLTAWQNSVLGLRIIWRDRALRALLLSVTVLAGIYLPTETVLLPAHFQAIDRPESLGFILAALSAGTIIGAFGYGWLSQRLTRLTIGRSVLVGTVIGYLALALLPPLPLMVTAGFALGLAWGPMQPLMNTVIQRRVDADAQGRVYGIQTSLFYALPPLSMVITGLAAERVGVAPVLLVLWVMLALVAIAVLSLKGLREING